ncbi:MAG: tyrosine-type recombinase/integrase [Lachnospiraceae bacterium]|nr:tyrosine-type recombinase/integrase [Lachnospiraceae bacterium]
MNTAQPIRKEADLRHLKEYYRSTCPNQRNYLLLVMGLNTALRISDILSLRWGDVYDFGLKRCKEHLCITEQKTDKNSMILINQNIQNALMEYKRYLASQKKSVTEEIFLFENNRKEGGSISRVQAFRIIKKAATACKLEGVVSCHSLRKTFGYYAWQQGIKPALLMNIYNHSSFQVTVRYLGIEQDDRDEIFRNIEI